MDVRQVDPQERVARLVLNHCPARRWIRSAVTYGRVYPLTRASGRFSVRGLVVITRPLTHGVTKLVSDRLPTPVVSPVTASVTAGRQVVESVELMIIAELAGQLCVQMDTPGRETSVSKAFGDRRSGPSQLYSPYASGSIEKRVLGNNYRIPAPVPKASTQFVLVAARLSGGRYQPSISPGPIASTRSTQSESTVTSNTDQPM